MKRYVDSAGSWRVHLRGASALITDIKSVAMQRARETLPASYDAALFFFCGVILWYDTLSCATTGLKPFTNCDCAAAGVGFLPMDKLIGSENWAMLCIMDIAFLDEAKNGSSRVEGNSSMDDVVDRAKNIEHRLEGGLKIYSAKPDTTYGKHPNARSSGLGDEVHSLCLVDVITQIFACSALVYLHVVVSGPDPKSPMIHESVNRTILALRKFADCKIVGTLSWPLCIAGCMASTEEQQDFFRDFSNNERMVNPMFGDSSRVLTIMQECWRMREVESGEESLVDWRSAMKKLELHVLLA